MTFLQKNVPSFLAFSNTKYNGTVHDLGSHHHHQDSTVKSVLFPPPPFSSGDSAMTAAKRDPGGFGFLDDVGGSVDGLMSCTESLGFESSDERRADDQFESLNYYEMCNSRKESTFGTGISRWKREHVKKEAKKFPPPLSSLDQYGKPTFFLRPVRKDGKLELREVKISRPEILCASRQDGRLRLHLVSNNNNEDEEDLQEQYDVVEEEGIKEEKIEEDAGEIIETEEAEEEEGMEERVEGWQIPVSPGGGDGFRRCHEQVSHHQNHHHHRHDFHAWSRHCVTIR